MTIRTEAHFEAEFPLEWIEENDGDTMRDPERPAAVAYAEILRTLGCQVGDVECEDEHGWYFPVGYEGGDLAGRMNYDYAGGYVLNLHCRQAFSLWPASKKSNRALVELLSRLNAALRNDGRFQSLRWFSFNESVRNPTGWPEPIG